MGESSTAEQLVEKLRLEQYARWEAGDPVGAEVYVQQHPVLQADPVNALKLVYQEVLLREACGDKPRVEEYLERFPQFGDQLKPLFALHEVLESSSLVEARAADSHGPGRPPAFQGPVAADYEILGLLGRGGMGVVYQARQVKLNRVVALKMILTGGQAGATEVARFRAEAETQARLQHPNIVQIFDVGEARDGPYFSMECVDGGSLAKHIAGTPQPVRPAAQLVETLARAIHHAHRCGLVHCDLKPANILLQKAETRHPTSESNGVDSVSDVGCRMSDFTPKVTDFGLAKWLRDKMGDSTSGTIIGTPSYMAPEQTTGSAKAIGPPVDVYALGAILYELLTGRPPFLGQTALDTLQQVQSQEPVPPRQLQPKVPRDLETICLKCLHKEPGHRYADAEALADDLRRFLGGEPIRARPVGGAERLWRACRRKPVLASLAAGLVVALVAGLSGVTWQWLRADRLRIEAERQRERAEEAQAQAQRRFQEVRALARTVIFEGHDKIKALPGSTPVQQFLVRTALTYFDQLAAEAADNPELLDELWSAYCRLGDVQGNTFHPNLGDTSKALETYRKGLRIAQTLAETDPDARRAQLRLVVCYDKIADIERILGGLTDALANYQQSFELVKAMAKDYPDDAKNQASLAVCHENLGGVLVRMGRTQEALTHFHQSLTLRETLAKANPHSVQARHGLAIAYDKIGEVQMALGQTPQALASFRQYCTLGEALAKADPNNAQAQRQWAVASLRIGDVQVALGQTQDALASYRRAFALFGTRAKADPDNAQAQRDLATSGERIADLLADLGQPREALAYHCQSFALREAQAKADPTNGQVQRNLAISHGRIGDFQARLGQRQEALASYRASVAIRQKQATAHPDNAQAQLDLANGYDKLGRLQQQRGQTQEALTSFRTSFALREKQAKADPDNAQVRHALGVSHERLGDIQTELAKLPEALAHYRQSFALFEALAKADPDNAQAQRALAISYDHLGDIQAKLGRLPEALADYRKGLAIHEIHAKVPGGKGKTPTDLAASHFHIGKLQMEMGQPEEALNSLRNSCALQETQAKADPDHVQAQRQLASTYILIGEALMKLGRPPEARDQMRASHFIFAAQAKARPDDAQAQRDLGIVYFKLGWVYSWMGADTTQARPERTKHWLEAQKWLERSQAQFTSLRQRGSLAAADAKILSTLAAGIAKCHASLAALEKAE
jgi:tetratricopeptide (TPR) repeat protein